MSGTALIVAARRTPLGAFQGALSALSAPQLGAAALRAALEAGGVEPAAVEEVLMGCVLQAGLGQAPARQAALAAGLPAAVPCTTLNKVCGSGMKAVMMACDAIRGGAAAVMAAGGMESMSNAPYLLARARGGYRLGHGELIDHLFRDGLENPYDGLLMGKFADRTAQQYGFDRGSQDQYAIGTVERALQAWQSGAFAPEIAAVPVTGRGASAFVDCDEVPGRCDVRKIPGLKPAFAPDGTVTAATASSIADGAAALVLVSEAMARERGLVPLGRIVAHASHAGDPGQFTTAPVGAIRGLLGRCGWSTQQVDLYEINEAFAVVTMAAIRDLQLDPARVNVNGGACALGHPIGATGARIIVTLLHALRSRRLTRGVAALCIGGGEATAVAIEAC